MAQELWIEGVLNVFHQDTYTEPIWHFLWTADVNSIKYTEKNCFVVVVLFVFTETSIINSTSISHLGLI